MRRRRQEVRRRCGAVAAREVVLGAQNTWTKYREKCMADGRW